MNNYQQTIIPDFGNAPRILAMIDDFNQNIDPSVNINTFYDYVMNIDTAIGFGLDIWGRILGITRYIVMNTIPGYFGFRTSPLGTDYAPFNQGPFYNHLLDNASYALSDDVYRKVLLAKAMANISRTDIPSLNRLLTLLFAGRGKCYVKDLRDMQMSYCFEFLLSPFEIAVLQQSNVLPSPTGVKVSIVQL